MALSYKVIFENNKKWVEKKLGEDADFFKNLAFKGLTEERISSVLAAAAAPIFEAGDRVYWVGSSEIEDIKLTDV